MNSAQKIILIPVVELQPANFSKVERVSPQKMTVEAPQEWLDYNQSCYRDSGLNHIKPIEPLSWLFKIESLSDGELKIILKSLIDAAAEDFDSINEILDDPIEYAPLIPGGYLFEVNKVVKSEPGCCCGLEDILEWKESGTLLTGHGDDDFIHISRMDAHVEVLINKEKFVLSTEDYDGMVRDAEMKIDTFIKRSGELINALLGIKTGQAFAKAMIYKWD